MKKYSKRRRNPSRRIKNKYRTKRNNKKYNKKSKKRTRYSKRNIKNKKSRIHHKKMIGGGPPNVEPTHKYLLSSEGETGKIQKWASTSYEPRSFKVDLYHGTIHLIGVRGSGNIIPLSDYNVVNGRGIRSTAAFNLVPVDSGKKTFFFDAASDEERQAWMNAIEALKQIHLQLKQKMATAVDLICSTPPPFSEREITPEEKGQVKVLINDFTGYSKVPDDVVNILLSDSQYSKDDMNSPLVRYIHAQISDVQSTRRKFRLVGFPTPLNEHLKYDGVYSELNETESRSFYSELLNFVSEGKVAGIDGRDIEHFTSHPTAQHDNFSFPVYGQLIDYTYYGSRSKKVFWAGRHKGWRIFQALPYAGSLTLAETNNFQADTLTETSDPPYDQIDEYYQWPTLPPEKWNVPPEGKLIHRPKLT